MIPSGISSPRALMKPGNWPARTGCILCFLMRLRLNDRTFLIEDTITMPPKLADVLRIDPNAPARPFPHFWEQMFGSGHANLSLRDQWREDARTVKKVTDFRYVRFHDKIGRAHV